MSLDLTAIYIEISKNKAILFIEFEHCCIYDDYSHVMIICETRIANLMFLLIHSSFNKNVSIDDIEENVKLCITDR